MLQNETMDEDLEHFKDVAEDDGNPANTIENEAGQVANIDNIEDVGADSDSSLSEDVPAPSGSESDASDENLLVGSSLDNFEKSKPATSHSEPQSEVSDSRPLLPGGYNPQHREPLYWYLSYPFSSHTQHVSVSYWN